MSSMSAEHHQDGSQYGPGIHLHAEISYIFYVNYRTIKLIFDTDEFQQHLGYLYR